MTKSGFAVGGLLLLASLACAAEREIASLKSCKTVYEEAAARIEQEVAEAQEADRVSYLASLDKAIAAMKKAGNLDALLAVRAEKSRFVKGEPIPEDEALPPFIVEGLSRYLEQARENKRAADKRRVLLFDQYIRRLKQLVVELTREDKIEEALAVKGEISRVEFMRADILSAMPRTDDAPKNDSETARHPADAKPFGGHWYKAVFEKVSWKQAKQRCEEMGGYLACIESASENRFVTRLGLRKSMHVGGTDEGTTGEWRWINGGEMRYTNWGASKPNGVGHQHYLWITAGGTWDDVHDPYPGDGFVCEWDK